MSSDKRILNYGDDIAQHRSSEWKYSFRVYYKRRPRRWQSLCWWVRSVKTRELVPHCSCRRNVFNSGQITFQQSYLSARCRAPTKTLSSALAPMTKDDESLLHRRGGGDLISARALPETNKKFRDEVIIFLSLFVADNGWRTPREWLKPLNHLIDLWGGEEDKSITSSSGYWEMKTTAHAIQYNSSFLSFKFRLKSVPSRRTRAKQRWQRKDTEKLFTPERARWTSLISQ